MPTLSFVARVGAIALSVSIPYVARAQAHAHSHEDRWRSKGTVKVTATHDDNVFLLSDTRKARLDAQPGIGPYADMAAAADLITTIRAAGEAKGPGLAGHEVSLAADARYDAYTSNKRRSNATLGVTLVHTVTTGGRLHARAEVTPKYFFRDYMADAADLNRDGSIQSAERIYAAGTYRDAEVAVGYRQRLVSASRYPVGVVLDIGAGLDDRSYLAPFAGRNYHGPLGTMNLIFDLGERVTADAGYIRKSLAATTTPTVLVLNESDFGVDLNGNGSTSDSHVRSVQNVDFSHSEQDLSLRVRVLAASTVELRGSYTRRSRDYSSTQPYDVYNNTRRDHRDQFGATLSKQLWGRTRLEIGGVAESQMVSRSLRPGATGEVNDYSQKRVFVGWSFVP